MGLLSSDDTARVAHDYLPADFSSAYTLPLVIQEHGYAHIESEIELVHDE